MGAIMLLTGSMMLYGIWVGAIIVGLATLIGSGSVIGKLFSFILWMIVYVAIAFSLIGYGTQKMDAETTPTAYHQ